MLFLSVLLLWLSLCGLELCIDSQNPSARSVPAELRGNSNRSTLPRRSPCRMPKTASYSDCIAFLDKPGGTRSSDLPHAVPLHGCSCEQTERHYHLHAIRAQMIHIQCPETLVEHLQPRYGQIKRKIRNLECHCTYLRAVYGTT